MRFKRVQEKRHTTPAEKSRITALREKYKNCPSPEELLASGDYSRPLPLGIYLKIKALLSEFRKARMKANLSLADLAKRTGIDRAYLSKLENLRQGNTTLETLARLAEALDLDLEFRAAKKSLRDEPRKRQPMTRSEKVPSAKGFKAVQT